VFQRATSLLHPYPCTLYYIGVSAGHLHNPLFIGVSAGGVCTFVNLHLYTYRGY